MRIYNLRERNVRRKAPSFFSDVYPVGWRETAAFLKCTYLRRLGGWRWARRNVASTEMNTVAFPASSKRLTTKHSTLYRRHPQTTPAIKESKSAYSRLIFFAQGPLPCQSVSNWAVWVMMWVFEIATDISRVCDPHPAGLWQSGRGFEPAAGSTLTFPQLGSGDVCWDQRTWGSE